MHIASRWAATGAWRVECPPSQILPVQTGLQLHLHDYLYLHNKQYNLIMLLVYYEDAIK